MRAALSRGLFVFLYTHLLCVRNHFVRQHDFLCCRGALVRSEWYIRTNENNETDFPLTDEIAFRPGRRATNINRDCIHAYAHNRHCTTVDRQLSYLTDSKKV